ncbi:MAG: phosphonopyruvate decarboxylase [Myxococcales bacterium]|nr:phosphonopyruvate decarboxylase [Myxococcales bacterium]
MIGAPALADALKELNYDLFTGVPCSFFKSMINQAIADEDVRYFAAANEGAAVAIAAGAQAAGRQPVVMLQNSGLGNMINPLTSLACIYGQPMLLLVSGRGYGVADEPQHVIMGRRTHDMLDACELVHADLPTDPTDAVALVARLTQTSLESQRPVAVVVPKGTVGKGLAGTIAELPHPMSRREAIEAVMDAVPHQTTVVATTGMTARELFEVDDQPSNFYMMGSMGHASAFGFGVAVGNPDRKVVILDGDGSVLMHMGSLSTVGHYRPNNLIHVVLDNEAYESTGNQDTTSSTTHIADVAAACGYASAVQVDTRAALADAIARAERSDGPTMVHVKVHRHVLTKPVRITTRWTAEQIGQRFHAAAASR